MSNEYQGEALVSLWRNVGAARTRVSLLTIFGFLAVTAMVICYALEDRSPVFTLAFAGACVLGSIYGFLQGAWPFGAVELVWSAIAVHRWRKAGPGSSRTL